MSEQEREYPVVMRMAGMWPKNLGGFERHRKRECGDIGHVDATRSGLNKPLLGKATWAQDVHNEIQEMRLENHARKLEKLKKRRRASEITRCIAGGPSDPWRATRHGPLREVIITANRRWFDDDLTEFLACPARPASSSSRSWLSLGWKTSSATIAYMPGPTGTRRRITSMPSSCHAPR